MAAARTRLLALGLPFLLLPAAAAAPAPAPVVSDSAMLDQTGALVRALAIARRVPVPTMGFRRRLVDADEARAAAAAVVAAAYLPAEVAVEQKMLQRLGLLATGADYRALLTAAVAVRPAALYDPDARRLYVPDWIALPAQRSSLAHEIAHALQDQRFGLLRFLRLRPPGATALDFDARLARQALVEGDAAVLAMEATDARGLYPSPIELAQIVGRMRAGLTAPERATPAVPHFLRELQAFPYVEGFAFVAAIRGVDPWSTVDALWAQPPESTAEILHPEKLARREPPLPIAVAPLALAGAPRAPARIDTLGELFIRLWLQPAAAPAVAERAAAGWRADRIAVYLPEAGAGEPAAAATLAWLTAWDSDADADDFLRVAGVRLEQLAGDGAAIERSEGEILVRQARSAAGGDGGAGVAGGLIFAALRRSDRVALLLGAPDGARPALAAILDDWRSPAPAAASPPGQRRATQR